MYTSLLDIRMLPTELIIEVLYFYHPPAFEYQMHINRIAIHVL
jgi:hypothetical protein